MRNRNEALIACSFVNCSESTETTSINKTIGRQQLQYKDAYHKDKEEVKDSKASQTAKDKDKYKEEVKSSKASQTAHFSLSRRKPVPEPRKCLHQSQSVNPNFTLTTSPLG